MKAANRISGRLKSSGLTRPGPGEPIASALTNAISPMLVRDVEHVPIESLRSYNRELRRYSDRQVWSLALAIRTYGFNNPIIVDQDSVVVAGQLRLRAARELGMCTVPVIRLRHLTPEKIREYRLADNIIASKGRFDPEPFRTELLELADLTVDFDHEALGLTTPEFDLIVAAGDEPTDPDDASPQAPESAVTQAGDIFCLGEHRVMCASALHADTWTTLLGDRQARMVFTDPPYNLEMRAFTGLGKTKHRDFAEGRGEKSEAEFTAWLAEALGHLARHCIDGALLYTWIDHRHMHEMMCAARSKDLSLLNLAVWDKQSGGMGSFLRSQHELCFIWKRGTAGHVNNVELGRHGRYRTNVWSHPGLSTFGRGRATDLADHPTVKPIALAIDAIKDCTHRGELVLDAFLGSGTTVIAAERTGRICYGTEIDPLYCDVIFRRWQERIGKPVIHLGTGLTLEGLRAVRSQAQHATSSTAPAATAEAAAGGPASVRIRQRPRPVA